MICFVAAAVGGTYVAEAKKRAGGAKKTETADCQKDNDCVAVQDDCCPCSQGGRLRAIPRKQRDSYEKDLKKRCKDVACTEAMSNDPSCTAAPFCGAGICELSASGEEQKTSDAP